MDEPSINLTKHTKRNTVYITKMIYKDYLSLFLGVVSMTIVVNYRHNTRPHYSVKVVFQGPHIPLDLELMEP